MKTIILSMLAAGLLTTSAMAQASSGSNSNNAVNVDVATYGSRIPTDTTLRTTGQAIANAPGTGIGVCSNGNAIGGGFIGGAVSIALSNKDKDCNARAWIGVLGSMAAATGDGRYIESAKNVACDVDMPAKAMITAGINCPQNTVMGRKASRQVSVASAPAAEPQYRIKRMAISDMPAGTKYRTADGRIHVKR